MRQFVDRHSHVIYRCLNIIILLLSVALIAYLSIDALHGVVYLDDRGYMTFQLWVCMAFIADFFIELYMSHHRGRYFLILSIPWLNIINHAGIRLSADVIYFARFIPLARGALAISIVFGYLSSNAVSSLLISYISIVVLVGYFGSLIFFQWEHTANPLVTTYWDALWWSCMNIVTVGCNIEPVTGVGKIVAVVLPVLGMVVFPLFTVYITNFVQQMVQNNHNHTRG